MAGLKANFKWISPFSKLIWRQLKKLVFLYDIISMFIWDMYPCPFPEDNAKLREGLFSSDSRSVNNDDNYSAPDDSIEDNSSSSSLDKYINENIQKLGTFMHDILVLVVFHPLKCLTEVLSRPFQRAQPAKSVMRSKRNVRGGVSASIICLSNTPQLLQRLEAFLMTKQALNVSTKESNVRFLTIIYQIFKISVEGGAQEANIFQQNISEFIRRKEMNGINQRGDVSDFVKFFLEHLRRNLNTKRQALGKNTSKWLPLPLQSPLTEYNGTQSDLFKNAEVIEKLIQVSSSHWKMFKEYNSSLIDSLFTGQLECIQQCRSCNAIYTRSHIFDVVDLEISQKLGHETTPESTSLNTLLSRSFVDNEFVESLSCACGFSFDDKVAAKCLSESHENQLLHLGKTVVMSSPPPCLILNLLRPSNAANSWIPPTELKCPILNSLNECITYVLYGIVIEVKTLSFHKEYLSMFQRSNKSWWEWNGKSLNEMNGVEDVLEVCALKRGVFMAFYKNNNLV